MDVGALRRDRETCVRERDRLSAEVDAFVLSHMDEIRDVLMMYECGVPEVSEEELLEFVRYKLDRFVLLLGEDKASIVRDGVERREGVEYVNKLLATEYCCRRLMNATVPREEAENDVDGYVNIAKGLVRLENFCNGQYEFAVDTGGPEHVVLDSLFSREFHVKMEGISVRWYILTEKLQMGLEVFRTLYPRSSEDLRSLMSYTHYMEKGFPVFVEKADIVGEKFLSEVKTKVEEEIGVITDMSANDENKALLVNYLLVMFNGVCGSVNLDYFSNKEELYLLMWAMPDK